MRDLFLHLLLFLHKRRLVIDLNGLFHPLILEFLYFAAAADAGKLESDLVAVYAPS
jgi:hypothetical protein